MIKLAYLTTTSFPTYAMVTGESMFVAVEMHSCGPDLTVKVSQLPKNPGVRLLPHIAGVRVKMSHHVPSHYICLANVFVKIF